MENPKVINITDDVDFYSLDIGRQGECGVTTFLFDMSEYSELYGELNAAMSFKYPYKDEYIPVNVTQNGSAVTWVVGSDATEVSGTGIANLIWYDDDHIKKSATIFCNVSESCETTPDAKEPYRSWIVNAIELYELLKNERVTDSRLYSAIDDYFEANPELIISEDRVNQLVSGYKYLTELKASTDYLTKSAASNTYQLKGAYLTKGIADSYYQAKGEYYKKNEVDNLVSAIPKFSIKPVSELPTSNISSTTVYLVVSGEENGNLYTEYIYVNDAWEKLGTQELDLSDYALKSEIPESYDDTEIKNELTSQKQKLLNKVGYAELNGNTLKLYADSTKANLIGSINLPSGGGSSSGSDWTEQEIKTLIEGYGYITSSALTTYAKKSEVPTDDHIAEIVSNNIPSNDITANTDARHTHSNKSVLDGITQQKVTEWNNKSTFDGNYDSLSNKPTQVTDSHINDLIDAKLTPLETLADSLLEVI